MLLNSRSEWKRILSKDVVGLKFNESALSPERVRDLWLNGHYFHDDFDKYDELEVLLSSPMGPFVRANFYDFVIQATKIIGFLGAVVRHALRHNQFKFS